MDHSGKFLKINGISLYYEIHGQGEPLLLLHGGGGSAENFDLMLPELAKHFQVITPDSRAQGRSTDTDEPLSHRLMVSDMVGLLDALAIDSAIVGGWSDGATIAMHMAIARPQRVRALLLTPAGLSAAGLTEELWKKSEQWGTSSKLVRWWRTRTAPTEEEMKAIHAPTLILAGDNEQFVNHEHFVQWQHAIPNSELVWIADSDHFLVRNKPAKVNQVILSFLQQYQ